MENNTTSEARERVIKGISEAESYEEVKSLCNEAKFQMIIKTIESAGGINKAANALGYKTNASIYHTIKRRLGKEPEKYQINIIQEQAAKNPPDQKYAQLLNDFVCLIDGKDSFNELHKACKKYFFTKKLEENDYKLKQTAEALGITKSSLKRAIETLGIHTKKNKFEQLDAQKFISKNPKAINALIPISTYQSLKAAYKEAQKHHIVNALLRNNPQGIPDLSRQLGHGPNAIRNNLKNLFGITYENNIDEVRETLRNYELSDSEDVKILVENSTNLKTLKELFTNANSAIIINALEEHNYGVTDAAKALKMDTGNFSKHISKLLESAEENNIPSTSNAPTKPIDNQTISSLSEQFSYEELLTLKKEATKAFLKKELSENNFNIQKTALKLGIGEEQLKNGIKSHFNVRCKKKQNQIEQNEQSSITNHVPKKIYEETINTIIPEFQKYSDLIEFFKGETNASIVKKFEKNNGNATSTAQSLNISTDAVEKAVLESIELS